MFLGTPKKYFAGIKRVNHWFSQSVRIADLRGISGEGSLFDGNVRVINACLRFLAGMPLRGVEFGLCGDRVYISGLGGFLGRGSDSASRWRSVSSLSFLSFFMCIENLFIWLYVLVMSHARFGVGPRSMVAWVSRGSLLRCAVQKGARSTGRLW